jgi:pimeloyl-[acyl-carrier protein] methyl ester esterase
MSRQWVLLRGLAREQAHWSEFSEMLQTQDHASEVIGIDLPGAGEYFRLSSPFSIKGIAEFVHSHFKKGPRPTQRIVVGISLGGMVATEVSRLYSNDIDGLALINSSFKNLSPARERLQLKAYPKLLRAALARSNVAREAAVMDMVSNQDRNAKALKEWAHIAAVHPVAPLNFLKQLFAASQYRLPERKTVEQVLVLTSQGDQMVNFNCSKALAEKWQVPIEIHPSAGHELSFDDPQWVVDQLKKYFI